jgi:hypothetical protein
MIFAFLVRMGVPQRLIAPALGFGAFLLIALCAALWLNQHDNKVLNQHEAAVERQVTAATNAANDVANAKDASRRAEDARSDEQLREVIRDAQAKHPEEVRRDAGPATSAVMRRLRERASASGPAASK